MSKIIITQSNYIPWKGYFTTMRKATHIILYDDAQYTRRDWRNRNKIVTPSGPTWLSIPIDVKGKYLQKINEAKVKNNDWCLDHWNKIVQNYKNAPCFKEYSQYFEDLYLEKFTENISNCPESKFFSPSILSVSSFRLVDFSKLEADKTLFKIVLNSSSSNNSLILFMLKGLIFKSFSSK